VFCCDTCPHLFTALVVTELLVETVEPGGLGNICLLDREELVVDDDFVVQLVVTICWIFAVGLVGNICVPFGV
jgi:hypothetical protein